MESTISKNKKIRNISPIKRQQEDEEEICPKYEKTFSLPIKTKIFLESKAKYATATSSKNNSPIENFSKTATISPLRKIMPKNINEYKHIINNFQLSKGDIEWTLDLRTYEKNSNSINQTITAAPVFYDDDFEKVKKRKNLKTPPEPFYKKENNFKLSHLVKNNPSFIDVSQLNFQTTLRNFTLPKGVKTVTHSKGWSNLAYKPKTVIEGKFLPPLLKNSKDTMDKIDKFVLREYHSVYDESTAGMNMIKRKKVMQNQKGRSLDFFGEHLASKPYSDIYKNDNIQNYRHILQWGNNSLSHFEIGLRTYGENMDKKHKLIRK